MPQRQGDKSVHNVTSCEALSAMEASAPRVAGVLDVKT